MCQGQDVEYLYQGVFLFSQTFKSFISFYTFTLFPDSFLYAHPNNSIFKTFAIRIYTKHMLLATDICRVLRLFFMDAEDQERRG